MTPEQIGDVTNAALWAHDQINIYGPGLALAAAGVAVSWTCSRIDRRRRTRRDIHHLEAFANHPANRSPRKEKP